MPEFQNPGEEFELCRSIFWLNLTFGILAVVITFDIKVHLSSNARTSMDDDTAHVASRVRLLGVVDGDGDVGWGHGHTEASSFCELVLAVPNLTWAKVYHLFTEKNMLMGIFH